MIRYSAHTHILNKKALELAKITRQKPTQEDLEKLAPGGRIWRDTVTHEPTGLVTDCCDWIFPMHNPWPYSEVQMAIKETCHEAVRFGITTIHEFTSWPDSTRMYQELLMNGELPLRVHVCPAVWGLYRSIDLDSFSKLAKETEFRNDWIKIGSAKIFVDAQGLDEKGRYCEWNRLTQDQLNVLVSRAHRSGIRVMMHAITRNGQNMALNAIEAALREMPKDDHRHRIEHFGGDYWPTGLRRAKELEIIPVPTPYSSYGWYGDPWLESAQPGDKVVIYRTLLDQGFMPPGNSDCMGTEPEALNPWWSIWCAVARKTRSGKPICPEEGTTVMESIRMYTTNSAYAGFEEKTKGSIEPGKLADLVVLAEDPFSIPIDTLKDIEVEMTMVGGRIVYNRK
jgi:predicted amidohydrolase YtcJ